MKEEQGWGTLLKEYDGLASQLTEAGQNKSTTLVSCSTHQSQLGGSKRLRGKVLQNRNVVLLSSIIMKERGLRKMTRKQRDGIKKQLIKAVPGDS